MMTRHTFFILLLGALMSLSSCASYVEEIYLNKDGSGKYALTSDMSSMLEMMEAMADLMPDAEDGEEKEGFWEGLGGEELTKSFALKDSVSQEVLESLEDPALLDGITMDLTLSKSQGKFTTTIHIPFQSLDDLQKKMTAAERINQQTNEEGEPKEIFEGLAFFTGRPGGHGFYFEKGIFGRKPSPEDFDMLDNLTQGEEGMETLEMMLEQSTMTTIVHLPGNVKEVSNQSKLGQVDGRKVTFEYNALDIIKRSVDTEFKIVFKP